MAARISSVIESTSVYKQLRRTIKRSINRQYVDIQATLKKYLTKQLRLISTKVSVESINSLTRKNIISAVKVVRNNFENSSMIILQGIDQVKTPLTQFKFLTDPIGYIKSLPNLTIKELRKNMASRKLAILSNLYKIENEIRNVYAKTISMLRNNSNMPKELVSRFQSVYRNATSQHFDAILTKLDRYSKGINQHFKAMSIIGGGKKSLRKRLQLLTQHTRLLKKKLSVLKSNFVKDLKQNITLIFTNEKNFKDVHDRIFKAISKDVNVKALRNVMSNLKKDLNQIINDALYPQLEHVFASIDNVLCTIKTNISSVYKKEKGSHILTLKAPGVLANIIEMEDLQNQYIVIVVRIDLSITTKHLLTSLPGHQCPLFYLHHCQ